MQPRDRLIVHYRDNRGVDVFQEWLDGLKDKRGRAVILKRLDRAKEGLFGDYRYVGQGVWELRIDFGPGYRVYFSEDGLTIVVLLLAGDKGSQAIDIRRAYEYWTDYRSAK